MAVCQNGAGCFGRRGHGSFPDTEERVNPGVRRGFENPRLPGRDAHNRIHKARGTARFKTKGSRPLSMPRRGAEPPPVRKLGADNAGSRPLKVPWQPLARAAPLRAYKKGMGVDRCPCTCGKPAARRPVWRTEWRRWGEIGGKRRRIPFCRWRSPASSCPSARAPSFRLPHAAYESAWAVNVWGDPWNRKRTSGIRTGQEACLLLKEDWNWETSRGKACQP